MYFWREGPVGGHTAPSEAKRVGVELDPEGPPGEPPERKKVSSVLFVRSAIMVSADARPCLILLSVRRE